MKSAIDIFAEGARDGVYPGGQLVVSKGGKRLVTACVGHLGAGLGEVTHDSIYDLASLTKPLATALLLLRAVERDRCSLADPLEKHVRGTDPRITLKHVLEHSAGYVAHKRFDRTLPASIPAGTWGAWLHIVSEAAKVPASWEPGSRAVYSDIGFILLGAVLESLYQLPLSTVFAWLGTRLFFRDRRGPPALPPMSCPHPIAPTEDVPAGFVHDENARAMGGAAGHAGLFGSADGVMRLVERLLAAYHGDSNELLLPETTKRMWTRSQVKGSTRTLGWDQQADSGSSTGGGWPATSVGHLGFTGTSVWLEPESAFAVVLVTNRVHPTRANNLIRRLRPALHHAAWAEWGDRRAVFGSAEPTNRITVGDVGDSAADTMPISDPLGELPQTDLSAHDREEIDTTEDQGG